MKVVVTGGAGFVGANLCAHLSSLGEVEDLVVLDDLSTGYRENLEGGRARLVEGSILDADLLREVCEGAHAIVHLAARPSVPRSIADPVASHRANLSGTLEILEVCRSMASKPHVIFSSSSSVYGANPVLPKSEDLAPRPLSPYAATKLAGEAYVLSWASSFSIPATVFRFFNVFGPLQRPGHAYAAVIPAFLEAALADRELPVHGDGTQSRDFTYVDTVVRILATAAVHRVTAPTPVNLAYGTRTTLLQVIAELESILEKPLVPSFTPSRPGDVPHSQADNQLLRTLFPDIVPVGLREGLAQTAAWMQTFLATS